MFFVSFKSFYPWAYCNFRHPDLMWLQSHFLNIHENGILEVEGDDTNAEVNAQDQSHHH